MSYKQNDLDAGRLVPLFGHIYRWARDAKGRLYLVNARRPGR